jgi:hypothetical protein
LFLFISALIATGQLKISFKKYITKVIFFNMPHPGNANILIEGNLLIALDNEFNSPLGNAPLAENST